MHLPWRTQSGITGAKTGIKLATIEAKVIRADGTVEDLGIISGYHKNPIKNWLMQRRINAKAKERS